MKLEKNIIINIICFMIIIIMFDSSDIAGQNYNVLVFSKTVEKRHDSIPNGIKAIKELGLDNNFNVSATEDSEYFTINNLKDYDVIIFLSTSGDILDEKQQGAFENYIQNGGGFVGIHSASATEYDWSWYGKLIGTYFDKHPKIQKATVNVTNRYHSSTVCLPAKWEWVDEWYNFKNELDKNINVLATVDESTYEGGKHGNYHPVMWCHEFDGGRSWYTSLGHTSEGFSDSLFANVILGGINYAAGYTNVGDTHVNSAGKKIIVDVIKIDSSRIVVDAEKYLSEAPIPLTDFTCERSLGTINDFYSEGDYWWPNPDDPDGPYVRRDGMSNPDYFKEHREAMRNMSIQVAALTAAYKITGEKKYAQHSLKHLKVWFVNEETKMNPNMNYAQAIKGICPGRGVGLIDAIHLVEPARAVTVLNKYDGIQEEDFITIQNWFAEFLEWMTTHEYGIDERERKNNHGTCWVMQAAEYATLTENDEILNYCRDRYKSVLLPNQMAEDGSFHLELKRTKPYGYSLFNIDIISTVCKILSTPEDNLWTFKLDDGRGMEIGMNFIYPYIKDKFSWPYKPDVMYWDEWPVRHPSLLFSGIEYKNDDYLELWKSLDPLPSSQEGLRNFPIRQPVLWID